MTTLVALSAPCARVERVHTEFILRACHDRKIEVYNERLKRWEPEALFDLVASAPFQVSRYVEFTHARRTRRALIQCGFNSRRGL